MCFSLLWFRDLLIWLVVLAAVVAILQLFVPWVLTQLNINAAPVMQILRIVIWAVVIIAVIYFVFALISCLTGSAGGLPLFPRGRVGKRREWQLPPPVPGYFERRTLRRFFAAAAGFEAERLAAFRGRGSVSSVSMPLMY